MKKEAAVFIVGCPRSGSTMLYRALQKHSHFAPDEENLSEAEFFHFASATHLFNENFPKVMPAYMGSGDAWLAFLEKIRPIRMLHRVSRFPALIRLAGRSQLVWRLFFNHTAARCFYGCAKDSRGGRTVLEKTNYYLHHIPKIKAAFPESKLLVIYRHPVDTYTSYLRRGRIQEGEWLNKSPEEFSQLYRRNMKAISANSQRLLPVSYEKFTSNPEQEFQKLCNYIGVPFEPGALAENKPDLERFEPDPHLFGKIVAKTKNWQEFLSENKAKELEDSLEDVMQEYGYEKYT